MKKELIACSLSVLLAMTAAFSQNWTIQNLTPRPPSSPITGSAMAGLGEGKALLFGGLAPNEGPAGTWVYERTTNTWTEKLPPGSPPDRFLHALSSIDANKVLLFGGLFKTDTWVYDGDLNSWTQKNPATWPSFTAGHAMSPVGDDKVLYYANSETWIYDLSDDAWTRLFPASNPSSTGLHTMAAIGEDKVVLFGGTDLALANCFNETWVFDLSDNNWTLQSPAVSPFARRNHSLASICDDQVMLFGGDCDGFNAGDTWIYDLSEDSWTLQPQVISPGMRNSHVSASIGNNEVVLFGGSSTDPLSDGNTFLYNATSCQPACAMTVSAGDDEQTYFGYSADECVTKTAVVTGGAAPYTYSWTLSRSLLPGETLTGAGSATVTICLSDDATLCLTVTDASGCIASDCAVILAEDVRCTTGNSQSHKIMVCHNGNEICVDVNAVQAHLSHGDYVGNCAAIRGGQTITNGSSPATTDDIRQLFQVFPNPGKGVFQISTESGQGTIRVTNSIGQHVKQITLNGQQRVQLKLDQPGLYYIQLQNGKQVETKKLLVLD